MKAGLMFRSIADRADAVITIYVPELSGYPAANAFVPERSRMLRSFDTTYVIDIELPADDPDIVQGLGLVDFKMHRNSEVWVRAWSDAVGGSNLVLDERFNPWQDFLGFGTGGFGAGGFGGQVGSNINPSIDARGSEDGRVALLRDLPAAGNTARYWRIQFSSLTGPFPFWISRIMLGRIWRPSMNMRRRWPLSTESLSRTRVTPGGQEYGDETPIERAVASLEFDWLSEADADYLWEAFTRLGRYTPVLARLKPIGGPVDLFSTLYATMHDVQRVERNRIFKRIEMTLREAL